MTEQTYELPEGSIQLKSRFLEMTGYGDRDILSWNPVTQKFLTRNGGLYQLTEDQIKPLKGPSPDPEDRL